MADDQPSLPFAAVMATGAASQLAGPAGVSALQLPLLWVTIALALGLAGAGAATCRSRAVDQAASFGSFTVPIGLAVIGSGMARLGGPTALGAAIGAVTLASASTTALMIVVTASVIRFPPTLASIAGAWFLAPAAVLADAIGIAALCTRAPGHDGVLGWIAVVAAAVGAAGYLIVAGLAGLRVVIYHLDGVARAPWWIAAGCGGLSAAALGRAGAVIGAGTGTPPPIFGWAAVGCWTVASSALVPVLVGSGRYLLGLRKLTGKPPWPPTFSTGVYALGAIQVGSLLHLPSITSLGDAAAITTLCLWGLTVMAYLPRLVACLP
jgi:hypothetical protein